SRHPLARAVREAAGDDLPQAQALRETAGAGVEGEVDGVRYRFGLEAFSTGRSTDDGQLPSLVLADAAGEIARFAVDEAPREGAQSLLAALREAGAEVEILSGDEESRVAAAATRLGVAQWRSGARPQDKLARLA